MEALLRAAAKTLGVSECPLLLEPWFGGELIEHAARLDQCGIRNVRHQWPATLRNTHTHESMRRLGIGITEANWLETDSLVLCQHVTRRIALQQ